MGKPFHSQDVISLYYTVIVVNLDGMDKWHLNTTTTSIQLGIVNCGLYWLTVTAYGNREGEYYTYDSEPVTVYHNVTYTGGKTSLEVSMLVMALSIL